MEINNLHLIILIYLLLGLDTWRWQQNNPNGYKSS